jgi:predicted SnoaL-like aldol condensation-catalyzing enzyme
MKRNIRNSLWISAGLLTTTFAGASAAASDDDARRSDERDRGRRCPSWVERQNEDIVVRFNELAFRDGRDAEALALVGDTYTNYEAGGVTTDRAALEGFLGFLGTNPDFVIDTAITECDQVVVRYETNATGAPTIGIDIYRVVGGKITEHWDSFALPGAAPAGTTD